MSGVTISVKADIIALTRHLNDVQAKQIPFAAALALTQTAKVAQAEITRALPTIFDKPTPFTQRGVGMTPATKGSLESSVFVKDAQAKYLELEETGGTRLPVKTAIVAPVDIKLNTYGNIPNKALQRMKGKSSVFVGKVDGIGGFWQRLPNDKLVLLAAFRSHATYQPKFHFGDKVRKSVEASLPALMSLALGKALSTARR